MAWQKIQLWILKVEYKEHFSGQLLHAVAEAPKEALPQECRPGFDTAWMTTMKFKVNATYHCKYTLGSHKADIYPDNLFNCQGKDPSRTEMVRRFCVLFTRSVAERWRSGTWIGYTITGIVLGMLSSICCVIVFRILQALFLSISKKLHAKKCLMPIAFVRLRRACLLVAYVSTVVWLLLQYRKVIGLKQLSFNSSLREM
ncbi:hypothetical protein HPP92_021116 [Vanilla planifolia]|uniref:Uncharacterized protein n=1 Tax=Vanilla planifolia TaxID=51239 RepID=A0A835PW17_VANPL|nr:hypothetical protein HPP92_021116 [Vanilla planifolia]